jgi:hypothetical protein
MRFEARVVFLLACGVYSACSSSTPNDSPPATTPAAADAGPPLPALVMNDVSVLIPIPSSPAAAGFLKPTSAGERGKLLPQAVYDKIPEFPVVPAQGLEYARMRAVAIRFDGCFPAPGGCEPQIRLVMQPITDQGETLDSALHLFYRLTTDELGALVLALRQLKALAPELKDGPLDVSPAIVAQGIEGPYGAGLREIVLTYAGEQNLTRMTFFLRAPPKQEEWFFGGFNRDGATMTPLDIVGVGKMNQRVDHPVTTEGYEYAFVPAPKKPEDVSPLLVTATAKTAPPADLQRALGSVARIENPTKYGPDQLDCAGCHVATTLAAHAKASLSLDVASHADSFKSSHDLTLRGESASTPSSLRAFGWFGTKPMIATRVVNETAAVIDDLEMRFPRK